MTWVAHGVGLVLLVGVAAAIGGEADASSMWWGVAAGAGGVFGLVLLFRGLAIGTMSVVAPTTAVMAALIPMAYGFLIGERPGLLAVVGAAVALAAVVLISLPSGEHEEISLSSAIRQPGVIEALGAGVGFAIFFILISLTEDGSGVWPLVASRGSSVIVLGLVLGLVRPRLATPTEWVRVACFAGVLDASANVLFLYAVRSGLITLVAVLTSLYPAGTVLLARLVLHERWSRLQGVGLALAGVGVGLIATG